MSNVVTLSDHNDIQEQAAAWVLRLEEGLTDEQQEELERWLDRDSECVNALLEMASLWDKGAALTKLVTDLRAKQGPGRFSSGAWAAGIAASLLFVFLGIGGYFYGVLKFQSAQPGSTTSIVKRTDTLYETAVGEKSDVRLTDGSIITLNTNTRLMTDFSDTERKVILFRGESLFEVAKDAKRPFLVEARGNTVRAVGTAFNVYIQNEDKLEVTVSEGVVTIFSPKKRTLQNLATQPGFTETTIVAGQVALIQSQESSVQEIDEVKMANRLAWQDGMRFFEDDRLSEVIEELQRYTSIRLVLLDDSLAKIRVAGYFKTGDVDGLLFALRKNFNIGSTRIDSTDGSEEIIQLKRM